jgi:hypothetical protein
MKILSLVNFLYAWEFLWINSAPFVVCVSDVYPRVQGVKEDAPSPNQLWSMKDTEHETHTTLTMNFWWTPQRARFLCSFSYLSYYISQHFGAPTVLKLRYILHEKSLDTLEWQFGHTGLHCAAGLIRELRHNAFIFYRGEMLATDAHLRWGLFWTSSHRTGSWHFNPFAALLSARMIRFLI